MFSVCEFCKSELAVLYCRADSASLCVFCDRHVHSANALSLNHTRFWICPASKKNGLFLCPDCDCSISSTTPVQGCPSATAMASLILDQGQRKRNTEVCQQLAEMARRDSLWLGVDFPELSPPRWYEEDHELLKQHGDDEDLLWDYNPTYDSSLIWEFRLDCEESGSTINESRLLVIPKQEISAAFEDNLSNQPMLIRPETEKELAKSEHVVPTRTESPKSKEDIEIMAQKRGNAMLRYMEKKKIRRYDKHIRYESRKARADARTRVKGRFVKSTQALNNQV